MNGGKVYNSLNYKLNDNVIKIIQRYTLPEHENWLIYNSDAIEFHSFFKCSKCKRQLKKYKPILSYPPEYKYICYKCCLLFR